MRLKTLCSIALATSITFNVAAQAPDDNVYSHYEEAIITFNTGDYDASYVHLKNALNLDSDHLPSKILMGRLLLINNLPDAAVTEFEEALLAGADPNIVLIPLVRTYIFTEQYRKATTVDTSSLSRDNLFEIYILQANAYRNMGNNELAFTFYQKSRLLQPNNTRVLNSMASLYLANEVWGKGKELIDISLNIDANDPKTLHLVGRYHFLQEQLVEAEAAFTKAYQLSPNDPVIQRSLSSVYMRLDKQDEAIALLEKIMEETPDPFSKLIYAKIMNKSKSGEAQKLFQEVSQNLSLLPEDVINTRSEIALANGLASYFQGNFEQAATELKMYLAAVSQNVNALKLLVDSHIRLEQYLEATRVLENYEQIVKRDMPLTVTLCNLYFELQRGFKCESIIREMRVYVQDQSTLNLLEIRSLNNRGASAEALALFEKHFNNVDFPFLRKLHVELLVQNGNAEKAREIIDTEMAIATQKGDIPYELYMLNTTVLMQEGRLIEALSEVDRVFAIEPGSSSARFLRAQILHHLKRFEDSIALLEQINKKFSPIEVNLLIAKNYQAMGELKQAEDIIQPIYEKNQKNLGILQQMVSLYVAKEDYESALWANQRLQKTSFLDVGYLIDQARIYLLANQVENAVVTFEKIANLVKDNPAGLIQLAELQSKAQLFGPALKNIRLARTMLNRRNVVDLQARLLQSTIMYQNQQLDQALALARSVVLDSFANEEWRVIKLQSMFLVSEIYLIKRNYDAAVELFVELFEQGMPNQAASYLYQLALQQGYGNVFETSAESLLEVQPQQSFVRRLLADYYMQIDEQNNALVHYEVLSNDPELPFKNQILNNMANILMEQDIIQAEILANQAFELDPYDAATIDTLGWIDFKKGNYLDALRQFRKAYVLDSTDPGIKFHLAYVLKKLDRNDEAKTQLNRLFVEHDDFPQRERAEELLQELSS